MNLGSCDEERQAYYHHVETFSIVDLEDEVRNASKIHARVTMILINRLLDLVEGQLHEAWRPEQLAWIEAWKQKAREDCYRHLEDREFNCATFTFYQQLLEFVQRRPGAMHHYRFCFRF